MSMMYQCPHCKAVLESEEIADGACVDCPVCGQEFAAVPLSIPAPEERVEPSLGCLEAWRRRWIRWYWTGRASRSEYWWGVLTYLLECLAVSMFSVAIYGKPLGPLWHIWYYVSLLPTAFQGVRRLHDAGHSGYWILIEFIQMFLTLLIFNIIIFTINSNSNLYYILCIAFLLLLGSFGIVLLIEFIFTLQSSDKGPNKYGQMPD